MHCKPDSGARHHQSPTRAPATLSAAITALLLAMAATTAHAGDVCEMESGTPPSTADGMGAVACGVDNDASGDWSIAFGRNN